MLLPVSVWCVRVAEECSMCVFWAAAYLLPIWIEIRYHMSSNENWDSDVFVWPKGPFSHQPNAASTRPLHRIGHCFMFTFCLVEIMLRISHLQCNCRPCDLSPQIRIQFLNENDRGPVPGGRSFIFDAIAYQTSISRKQQRTCSLLRFVYIWDSELVIRVSNRRNLIHFVLIKNALILISNR